MATIHNGKLLLCYTHLVAPSTEPKEYTTKLRSATLTGTTIAFDNNETTIRSTSTIAYDIVDALYVPTFGTGGRSFFHILDWVIVEVELSGTTINTRNALNSMSSPETLSGRMKYIPS